ncbi:hypothetical protein NEAUS06_2326 [Nematocida ausubeli]|nr:hypothetical protein NEAUS06_2017 [Nematocida ausubeli]KAI5137712.1 hypothetical protein NEAUS06_2326 [Nematocida ausubeli]
MLIDFKKKKKLVVHKEKEIKKQEKTKRQDKPIKPTDIDMLILKSKEALDEDRSIFSHIPYENAEIAIMVDPCTKTHKNTRTLYEQYKEQINK